MAKRTSATAVWTGHLNFSMISVPVKAYAASRSEGISFNQVHQCEPGKVNRIKQQNVCSGCSKVVESAQMSKGFEVSEGQYAVVTDVELAALNPAASKTVEVTSFVPMAEIDPIYFDKSYFIGAVDVCRKAYEMLFQTMKNTALAGVAKLVMRGKEYDVVIRIYGNGLMMHTLFSKAEVRELVEYKVDRSDVPVAEAELALAKMLLQSMTKPFDANNLVDTYSVKVQALMDSKTATGATTSTPTGPVVPKNSNDLMAALQASLAAAAKPKETAMAA